MPRIQNYLCAITLLLIFQLVQASEDAQSELIAIEESIAASVLKLDFDLLDSVYADDFVFLHSTGVVETKADWLSFLRENPAFYSYRNVDDIHVELHDDVAVTNGRIHIKTTSDDPDRKEFVVWYIRVYQNRDNRWQLISHRSVRQQLGPPAE